MVTETQAVPQESTQPDVSPYLAEAVNRHLTNASGGHCIRVNHLTRDQALAVIRRLIPMSDGRASRLTAKVLGDAATDGAPMTIRTDQAIEYRNRKEGVFCLFVPAGAHNTTASSLGNSFAEVNGTELMEAALAIVLRQPGTSDSVKRAIGSIRAVFAQTSAAGRPTVSDMLFFAVEASSELARDPEAKIGLGLWRVGLIPDRGDDFESRMRRNRTVVAALARPAKMTASLDERVNGLKLVQESARRIRSALSGQPLHTAKGWTHRLASVEDATFDWWEFADEPTESDCREVRLKPFLDERGALIEANGKGLAQQFPGAPLLARIGEKHKLTVKWETTPVKTTVPRWQVEIIPADERDDWDETAFDLPTTEIKKANARTGNLNLNLPFFDDDDLPQIPLRVRVRAIAETGEEIVGPGGQVLEARSDEFYLAKDAGPGLDVGTR
jgi:DNA phosphorothioation-dependent restriction protein DptH